MDHYPVLESVSTTRCAGESLRACSRWRLTYRKQEVLGACLACPRCPVQNQKIHVWSILQLLTCECIPPAPKNKSNFNRPATRGRSICRRKLPSSP